MNLAQYVPALEWLGLHMDIFSDEFGEFGTFPTGEYAEPRLDLGGTDCDNAVAIILILDAIEAKGDTGGLYKPLLFKRDTDYECAFAGAYFKYGSFVGPTRTIAVLEAAKALHEKEGGNG